MLVTGAAGGVGSAVVAIALWRGARVIAAVLDEVERYGISLLHPAAEVVVAREEPLAVIVRGLTDGRGVDIAFDTVGNPVFRDAVSSLAAGGRMIVITAGPNPIPFDLLSFYRTGGAILAMNSTRADSQWAAGLLRSLMPGFESGALPPPRIELQVPLEEGAQAFLAVHQGGLRGRVLIHMGS